MEPNASPNKGEILIVEDEEALADLYTAWLQTEFDVATAYDGTSAMEVIDNQSLDGILLDRRMPGLSGDAVLEQLREKGIECPVAMVTAVEPDFDIIEMGFDDYIVKPVAREELMQTVNRLLDLRDYESAMQRYFSLSSKKAALEVNKTAEELESSAEYQQLVQELNNVKELVDQQRTDVLSGDAPAPFNDRVVTE